MKFYVNAEDSFARYILQNINPTTMDGNWAALTLTLRQGALDGGGLQKLTRSEVKKCIALFLKSLNQEVNGPAYRRFHKKLAVIPVIESKNARLHVHMLLERPARIKHENFEKLVGSIWDTFRWSLSEKIIKSLDSFSDVRAWIQYILKDANGDYEVLDIDNLYLPWQRDNDQMTLDRRRHSAKSKATQNLARLAPSIPSTVNLAEFYELA